MGRGLKIKRIIPILSTFLLVIILSASCMQDDDDHLTTMTETGVTLEWDANTAPDLAGYRVYYKTGSSGEPYNGTGATEGDSPVDIGNVTTYMLHGLAEDVTYFFVVTAYDTEGLESDYSNEETIN
jgi:hypothetical protein